MQKKRRPSISGTNDAELVERRKSWIKFMVQRPRERKNEKLRVKIPNLDWITQ